MSSRAQSTPTAKTIASAAYKVALLVTFSQNLAKMVKFGYSLKGYLRSLMNTLWLEIRIKFEHSLADVSILEKRGKDKRKETKSAGNW